MQISTVKSLITALDGYKEFSAAVGVPVGAARNWPKRGIPAAKRLEVFLAIQERGLDIDPQLLGVERLPTPPSCPRARCPVKDADPKSPQQLTLPFVERLAEQIHEGRIETAGQIVKKIEGRTRRGGKGPDPAMAFLRDLAAHLRELPDPNAPEALIGALNQIEEFIERANQSGADQSGEADVGQARGRRQKVTRRGGRGRRQGGQRAAAPSAAH